MRNKWSAIYSRSKVAAHAKLQHTGDTPSAVMWASAWRGMADLGDSGSISHGKDGAPCALHLQELVRLQRLPVLLQPCIVKSNYE